MPGVAQWREDLTRLDPAAWPEFLDTHSGLPGPRGNIELAMALAELAADDLVEALIASGDEYRVFCGVVALGPRATEPDVAARLRILAADARWRVREAVAIGLQRLGDNDFDGLASVVSKWAKDADPLVQRAAAAAICEPRLLRTPEAAGVAIETCRRATADLAARPASTRREPGVRTLRQGLGYCWSVAVAADPEPGLIAFEALDDRDPDVAWIINHNLRKARLARLVPPAKTNTGDGQRNE
ncbi:HEAT repeat domain-containing protein [Gordonia sp. CPCC 206044]|uniref:HEAT repeat domain-containing protein n=1 Tax=Gordonia sp. CPCC 206044 TaxID=3140793 RepID=UPI003AF33C65